VLDTRGQSKKVIFSVRLQSRGGNTANKCRCASIIHRRSRQEEHSRCYWWGFTSTYCSIRVSELRNTIVAQRCPFLCWKLRLGVSVFALNINLLSFMDRAFVWVMPSWPPLSDSSQDGMFRVECKIPTCGNSDAPYTHFEFGLLLIIPNQPMRWSRMWEQQHDNSEGEDIV